MVGFTLMRTSLLKFGVFTDANFKFIVTLTENYNAMKTFENFDLQLASKSLLEVSNKTMQFGKFVDGSDKVIVGTSMQKGFEKHLEILFLQTIHDDRNSVVIFIPNSAAINGFIDAKGKGMVLKNVEISAIKNDETANTLIEKLTLSKIKVSYLLISNGLAIIELSPEKLIRSYYPDRK